MRTLSHLDKKYKSDYAFVGIGQHSMNNLYPVLKHLNVPLKYIVTQTKNTALAAENFYDSVIGSDDFETVINDDSVSNFFVCTPPKAHYEIVKRLLSKNKNVFVEKPPCSTLDELEDLIKISEQKQKVCLVGMQRRYSPVSKILKRELKSKNIISYNYRFLTGKYPEGDAFLDLYIHPLDFIFYVFGAYEVLSIYNTSDNNKAGNSSIFMHLKHGNVIGSIEISTDYTWQNSKETVAINTEQGVFELENHVSLTFQKKQASFLSIPLEKIWANDIELKYLYQQNNFIPTLNNNQVFTMGYYTELSHFIKLCEGEKAKNLSELSQLKPTFELIKLIKKNNVQ